MRVKVQSAHVAKVGNFTLTTVGSLKHGGPYVAIKFKSERVGWYSFKDERVYGYDKPHELIEDAMTDVGAWFLSKENYNKAANAWNSMNIGVSVKTK